MPPCGVWGVLWALTVAQHVSQCHSQTWEQLVPKVVHELERLWLQDDGKINILGNDCVLSVELKKSGRHKSILTCPGWTDVVGRAVSRNRYGVVDDITRDFFRKAIKKGIVNEKQTDRWLKS